MAFLNIAAYKFIELDELPTLRLALKSTAQELALRGTILLSTEGINLMLAGLPENIEKFQAYLARDKRFHALHYKKSYSAEQTYNRLLVKIKKEIIAFGQPEANPLQHTAPYLSPQQLKTWYEQGREMILLDTRNDYEVRLGTFQGALDLSLQHFRDLPLALQKLDPTLKQKTVVTFCTGGIRCEKAALYLQQQGFQDVYQLEGGILDYFVACGNAYYQGECFVFDRRVSVNAQLEETGTVQCFACLQPVSREEQQSSLYIPDKQCPHCVGVNTFSGESIMRQQDISSIAS